MFRPASFAAGAALLLATPMQGAHAQGAPAQDRTAEVDRIFSFATAETPGCATGVSQHGRVVVSKAYGLADVERRLPLTQASLFDIGSTQKQFTAAAVLMLVADGRLSLDDDIRKHLPELADYGHKVTVDNLLTHTGGIRDWTGMLPLAPEGTDVLSLIQRQRGLDFAPGTEWSYSNSGFELAKAIVARVSGMSFAEFTRRRLFEPLGMQATAYVPDILQAGANASRGYQKDGAGWRPFMRLGTNRGGGAIVSNVGDILTWNHALASGRLGSFVTGKMQEPARLSSGRTVRYGRGLMIDSTARGLMISHSGGAAGYSTWMGRVPAHGLVVTVACNFDPVSATGLAARVVDLFLPPAAPRAPRPGPVAAAGVDVAGRAGLFFDERTGEPMRLTANDGRLAVVNGPPLVPVSATSFRPPSGDAVLRAQDEFEMTFRDADHVEVRSPNGEVTRYRRAKAWTPDAADLQAVDGRYESRDLGAVYEIVAGTNALVMRIEGAPGRSMTLTPVERDVYMLRLMKVRFHRDAGGRVTGFDYSNPVVRHLAFTRVGDRTGGAPASTSPASTPPASSPPAPATAASTAAASTAAAPKLDALAGEYELAPGRTVAITLEGGQLHGQPSGGAKRALAHVSGTTFAATGTALTLTFTLGADGRATAMVMRQDGNERTLPRVR